MATLKEPRAALVRVRYEPQWPLLAIISQWRLSKTQVDPVKLISYLFPTAALDEIRRLLLEINSNTSLYHHLEQKSSAIRGKEPEGVVISGMSYTEAEVIYAIVRLLKPDCVVETGVAAGISSTFILEALHQNNKGELWSIDLPSAALVEDGLRYWRPAGEEPGWMIPDSLRSRWHLVLGSSQHVLVPLLERLGKVDLFHHDSLHTFRNMEFEYQTAWRFIREGGCLLSHDVTYPYLRFCHNVGTSPVHYIKIGGVRK